MRFWKCQWLVIGTSNNIVKGSLKVLLHIHTKGEGEQNVWPQLWRRILISKLVSFYPERDLTIVFFKIKWQGVRSYVLPYEETDWSPSQYGQQVAVKHLILLTQNQFYTNGFLTDNNSQKHHQAACFHTALCLVIQLCLFHSSLLKP